MYCAIDVFGPCVSVAIEVAAEVAAMVAILRMRFSCLDPRVKCFTIDWTVRNIRRGFIFGHLHLGMIRYRASRGVDASILFATGRESIPGVAFVDRSVDRRLTDGRSLLDTALPRVGGSDTVSGTVVGCMVPPARSVQYT